MLRLLKQRTLIQRIHNPIITHESAVSHFASSAASTRRKDAFAPCGALKRLTSSKGKTAGRNSSGRITSFHRGGGAKRLQRKIDLKRRTSSVGIVERIEYDPNRTSRIALVRWTEGVKQLRRQRESEDSGCDSAPPPQILDDTKVTSESVFSFSSLPGKVGLTKVGCLKGKKSNTDDTVVVGFPEFKGEKKKTPPVSFNSALDLPWIAVAGAKPAFFAPKLREKTNNETGENSFCLSEIQKYKNPKPKRKGAISWHSDYNNQYPSGLLVASEQDKSYSTIITSQLIANALSKNRPSNPNNSRTFRKPLVQAQSTQINRAPVSYILASNKCSVGATVMNVDFSKPSKTLNSSPKPISNFNFQDSTQAQTPISSYNYDMLDISSKPGNCIPLKDIRMGTFVHDIECHPGQGAKLARGAGSYGKIVKEPAAQCLIRLPSGVEKLIDARCRATIGIGSNVGNRMKKLRKAGHSRWLGRRPVVRGVAMNPVDHPHGGGEGRTKGGRPSVSPWGKPTKAGFKSPGVKKTKMMAK